MGVKKFALLFLMGIFFLSDSCVIFGMDVAETGRPIWREIEVRKRRLIQMRELGRVSWEQSEYAYLAAKRRLDNIFSSPQLLENTSDLTMLRLTESVILHEQAIALEQFGNHLLETAVTDNSDSDEIERNREKFLNILQRLENPSVGGIIPQRPDLCQNSLSTFIHYLDITKPESYTHDFMLQLRSDMKRYLHFVCKQFKKLGVKGSVLEATSCKERMKLKEKLLDLKIKICDVFFWSSNWRDMWRAINDITEIDKFIEMMHLFENELTKLVEGDRKATMITS